MPAMVPLHSGNGFFPRRFVSWSSPLHSSDAEGTPDDVQEPFAIIGVTPPVSVDTTRVVPIGNLHFEKLSQLIYQEWMEGVRSP